LKTESLWLYYAIGSALFGGATAILAKVGVSGIDSNVATFLRTLVVLVFAGVIVSIRADWTGIGTASVRTLTFLALSGLATGASWAREPLDVRRSPSVSFAAHASILR
jgi:transporter family protein